MGIEHLSSLYPSFDFDSITKSVIALFKLWILVRSNLEDVIVLCIFSSEINVKSNSEVKSKVSSRRFRSKQLTKFVCYFVNYHIRNL